MNGNSSIFTKKVENEWKFINIHPFYLGLECPFNQLLTSSKTNHPSITYRLRQSEIQQRNRGKPLIKTIIVRILIFARLVKSHAYGTLYLLNKKYALNAQYHEIAFTLEDRLIFPYIASPVYFAWTAQ